MAFVPSLPIGRDDRFQHSSKVKCTRPRTRRTQAPTALHNVSQRSLLRTLDTPPRIALTREKGKNDALIDAIENLEMDAEVIELNCVETVVGPDAEALPDALRAGGHDWLTVTSPEAASVVIKTWRSIGCPALPQIAAVGRATGDSLRAVGLDVAFEPSRALAKVLGAELPGPAAKVLYAGSLRAPGTLEKALSERGFEVQRLNTYSTEAATFDEFMRMLAADTHVVTFASPSAVASWVDNVGVRESLAVACIGETSANAAKKAGFEKVHYPVNPGLQGWIESIQEALKVAVGFGPGEK